MTKKQIWCLVYKPDGSMFEFYVKKEETGRECLIDVCRILKIVEIFYLGFQIINAKKHMRWINLRNQLKDEVKMKPPLRLYLSVKYFINPQAIIQSATEDLFYHTILARIRNADIDLGIEKTEIVLRMTSIFAFIELKSLNLSPDLLKTTAHNLFKKFTESINWEETLVTQCTQLLLNLPSEMTVSEGKALFLRYASQLSLYGSESFRLCFYIHQNSKYLDSKTRLRLYVCTDRISVQSVQEKGDATVSKTIMDISFASILSVSFQQNMVTVKYHRDTQEQSFVSLTTCFKFQNFNQTFMMFKIFTEFHTFFHCRSIKRMVYNREYPSLKSLPFIFSFSFQWPYIHKIKKSRRFMFDVFCTRRRAYEHVYRFFNVSFIDSKKGKSKLTSVFIDDPFHIHLIPFGLLPEGVRLQQIPSVSTYQPEIYDSINLSPQDPNFAILRNNYQIENEEYEEKHVDLSSFIYEINHSWVGGDEYSLPQNREPTTQQIEEFIIQAKQKEGHKIIKNLEFQEKLTDDIENQSKKFPEFCVICLENSINSVFCPCGHAIACLACSEKCTKCPFCRTNIHLVQRVYFPS